MINAQSLNCVFRHQLAQELMSGGKYMRILHAQADQVVDVKEAPVIDFFSGNPPVGETVHLGFQQAMQAIEAARAFRGPVALLNGFFGQLPYFRYFMDQPVQRVT